MLYTRKWISNVIYKISGVSYNNGEKGLVWGVSLVSPLPAGVSLILARQSHLGGSQIGQHWRGGSPRMCWAALSLCETTLPQSGTCEICWAWYWIDSLSGNEISHPYMLGFFLIIFCEKAWICIQNILPHWKCSSRLHHFLWQKSSCLSHSQCYGCWWPGDEGSQDISSHGVDLVPGCRLFQAQHQKGSGLLHQGSLWLL